MSCGRQWRHLSDDLGHLGRLLQHFAGLAGDARNRGDDEDAQQVMQMVRACVHAFDEALERAGVRLESDMHRNWGLGDSSWN